jgi:hypothetical protein
VKKKKKKKDAARIVARQFQACNAYPNSKLNGIFFLLLGKRMGLGAT